MEYDIDDIGEALENAYETGAREVSKAIFARIKEELGKLRKNIKLNSFETISKHFDQGRITGIDRSIEIIEQIEREV